MAELMSMVAWQDMVPTGVPTRKRIEEMEEVLKTMPQIDIPLRHYFGLNTYAREGLLPKDTLITTMIWKVEQICIISKGEVSVLTDKGMIRIKAPYTFVGPPGAKRVVYVHEECVWTTILGTSLKDPEEIMKQLASETDDDYCQFLLEQPPTVEPLVVDRSPIVDVWKSRFGPPRLVVSGESK